MSAHPQYWKLKALYREWQLAEMDAAARVAQAHRRFQQAMTDAGLKVDAVYDFSDVHESITEQVTDGRPA